MQDAAVMGSALVPCEDVDILIAVDESTDDDLEAVDEVEERS